MALLESDLPASSRNRLASAQETTTEELAGVIAALAERHGGEIEAVAREVTSSPAVNGGASYKGSLVLGGDETV